MNAAWVVLLALLGPTEPADQYPPRLRKALESRLAATSQVEWTLSWIGGRDDGLVERYVTRQAGDALWESNLGDKHGYHQTSYGYISQRLTIAAAKGPAHSEVPKQEAPLTHEEHRLQDEWPKEETAGTRNSLIYDGKVWYLSRAERASTGMIQNVETVSAYLPLDLPSIGLAPSQMSMLDANPFRLPNKMFEGFDSAEFREGFENGLPTVSAEWGESSRLTWRFDDRQGGKPVSASFEINGEPIYSSETEYEQIGERWIPKSVRFYEGMSTTPYKMIDVQRATFDEPWHMQEITPNDLGALYGTEFTCPDGGKVWTGAGLIPVEEYFELMNLYGILPDPKIQESMAKAMRMTMEEYRQHGQRRSAEERAAYKKKYGTEPWLVKKSPKEKDEWDIYVEEFLTKHKLPAPGVQRANEVRDQSKKLRDAYRRKNESKIRDAKKEGDPRKIAECEGIEKRIFDNVLVRELYKLVQDEKDSPKKEP